MWVKERRTRQVLEAGKKSQSLAEGHHHHRFSGFIHTRIYNFTVLLIEHHKTYM